MANNTTKSRYYQFYDENGKKFNVDANAFDSDMKGFSEAYPDVSMRMVDKNGEQWDIPVANVEKAMKEGGYRMWQGEQIHVTVPKKAQRQVSSQPARVQQPRQATRPQTPQGFGQLNMDQARRPTFMSQKPTEEPIDVPQEESIVDKTQRQISGNATPEENRQVQNRMQQRMDEIAYEQETGKRMSQASDIPFTAPTLARDEYGNIRHNDDGNVLTGITTDEDRVSAHQQVVQEQKEWDMDQDLRDIRSEEERLTEQRKAAEENKRPEDKTLWDFFKEGFGASAVSGMAPMGTNVDRSMVEAEMTRKGAYGAERQAIAKESDVLMARRRLTEEAKQLITDVRKDQQGYGILSGLGRAGEKVLEGALDPHTWDFGEADLATQMAVADAVIKLDSGLGISQNEQKLLDTWAKNAAINSKFADQLSGWTKAAIVTRESLPFMLEMAMNPASGLGQAASTQLLKYSLKKYGTKWVKDHAKSMLAKKIATRLVGDVVGSGIMASTTGAARVAADYERRMTGQVDIALDNKGNVIYNGIKQDTKENPGAALFKALSSTSIENWSEMAGNYLGFINSFFGKALGKSVIGKAGRKALQTTGSIEGVSLNKAQKFIYDLAAGRGIGAFSQGLKQFAERTKWNGLVNEYLEEEIGNIANAITVGDMTLDTAERTGVFNLQQNIDTFCGVALMGGFMSTLNTAGFAAHKWNYDLDRVSNANSKIFGDELWQDVKTMIDSSINDPRELNDALTYILRGETGRNYNKEEKEAVLKYTQAALEKQGAEMAEYQPRMASSTREEVTTEEGKKYVVTSLDKNGDTISQQAFDSEDEAMAYEGELKMNQQQRDYKDYLSMTNKLSYPEAAQTADEFLAENGYSYLNDDDAAAMIANMNDPKTELGKQFRQYKMEKILQKAENNRAAIESFEEENGWTPGTVAWLAEQDPMQLDAEGLAMADQARTFLEGLAYPAGEVHVEHEQQVGAETAKGVVENVVSDEVPIEPGNNAGSQLLESFVAADNALTQLFERNEDLKEEYTRLVGMGLSPQEVISSLDSFRPEEVQAVIDHFNAKARYESFMDEAGKQIDSVARRSREQHTFKGTIDGKADLNNVHTITDGTNRYYLVSGDIITDPATGRITGSTSGLIIGMDLDGSLVQLNETDGYSLEPVTMSLDQFEEAERERLQQQVTMVVDPNQTMNLEAQQQQEVSKQPTRTALVANEDGSSSEGGGDTIGQAGAEASANGGTGANETPATPVASIESVTDKDGIKRYENGIPVDNAIADIQNDGFDVNEVADASIAEAQQTIDKIDKKPTRTRKDLMDKKNAQDVINYYNNVKARWAEINQPAESEENVNNQPEQPQIEEKPVTSQKENTSSARTISPVEAQKIQRIKDAKVKYGDLFDDDFTKANDIYELVSMYISRKRVLAWEDVNNKRGLQKELGWKRRIGGDTRYIESLLAKKGEGIGIDEYVHMIWESPENSVNGEKRWDDTEIKDALLDLIQSAGSKSDIVDYALNTRIEAAEAAWQEQQRREKEEAGQQIEIEPLTAEEIANMEANLPFAKPVEGEDIPDSPITLLSKAVEELQQQEGMPPIKLVDTDRMSDDEWYDIASQAYGGAFVSQEDIDDVRNTVLADGVYANPETGAITVYSDSQTAEEVKYKVEQINEYLNGRSNKEETGGLEAENVQRSEEGTSTTQEPETPAAEGAAGSTSQGDTEPVVDEYLQPRNAEEEQIIANVLSQLQQDISDAVEKQNKARSALQEAQVREGERATDMFGNDNALNQPGQIFDNSDMPVDQSAEGVERRTTAERKALQEATDNLNKLQSLEERNSRIRGALDNHRRQTKIETDNPIEAIEQAAQSFAKEQQETINKRKERWQGKKEPAYGADNKLVTTERYEELKKRMIKKIRGQLNSGFDPEMISIGAEMAMYHIEAGAKKFADYATRMIADLGDAIRPYLQSFYEAARRMPGMEQLRKEMDSTEYVDNFDVLSYDKQGDKSVNDNKQEDNVSGNDVSLQQEASEEVGRKAEDADKYRAFSQAVAEDMLNAMETGEKPYKSINDIRKKAKQVGLEVDDEGRTDILLQELVEDGLVSAARQYVNTYMVQQMMAGKKAEEVRTSRDLFNDIVRLYNLQPSITQRSSNRIKMQQYSTPLPMSFIADVFATPNKNDGTVLEPTAGNGMMVFAVPEYMVHANELDPTRLDNLKAQKFQKVTDQDATLPFEGDEQYDAIIANPPFGSTPAKMYDGKEISGLAQQIALNALSKMKDNGKAAIIIGGNMEYGPNGAIKSDKAFFTYLYDHYNVKGVIDMDGKLYAKQGTTYPTRLILIDGRRSEEERAQAKVYPPTIAKAVGMKAKTFDELFDIAERIRNNNNKTDGTEILRTPTGIALPDNNDASGNTDGSGRSGQSRQNESNGGRTESRGGNKGSQTTTSGGTTQNRRSRSVGVQQPRTPGLFDTEENTSQPQSRTGTNKEGGSVSSNGESRPANVQGERVVDNGVGLTQPKETPKSAVIEQPAQPIKPKVEEKRELNTDKLSYRPHNTAFSLNSVAPAAMVEAMDDMLSKIEKEHGNIDAWVTKELGYDSVEDMHNALAAEQVDSVAMAIYQMQHGQGMIIGDQTGVGKGRQMAALIRWACRQGKKPIFITQKADLFSDIYRDLVDIGSGELRPFIFNSDGAMVDNNGITVHKPLSAATQAKVFAGDKLPDGYDFAVLTYSQVNTGDQISQDEAKQAAKDKGERYQKKKSKDGKPKATPKATFLRALAKDNYMFLDESHTAAGKSNTGYYFQSILKTAKAVTFASATFAKRPDTMPMYAIRTAMAKAKVKADELIKIIENGGVTLQEIMSRALTQAGQMVRRERDMSDVVTDWKTVDDPATVKKARDNYDRTIEAFNAIIDFQKNYVTGYLDRLSKDLADVAASAGLRQGTEDLGIKNVPFASKTYNYTKQLMLALKVDAIVDEVVKEIEAGRHPVIALENTMGSMLDDYAPGDTLEETTFAASLLKGLKGVLRYTITDEDGKQQQDELKPEQLGPEGEAAYHEVEDFIRESTSGIFISPLDAITEKLQQKGYKVGELTGRQQYVELDENTGEYVVRRRTDRDKKKMQREFNNGTLDVLILNKSASTGISLHASEKFSDQRQRTMIIAQPLADINDYMQMIGRIDRTGQVHRGYYINLGLPVPAEGRFLMMLSTKLKSLNANTTTSQENESNDVEAPDLLNKYGSKVVVEYLRDNPDIYVKMGEPLKKDKAKVSVSELDSYEAQEDDARKITGYVALLPTDEQDAFYNDVVRRYNDLIKYLNDTGSNDLKISVLPLRARTIDKQISSEGADPKGDNPFAGHAYVEWVDMDVLKKPMKAAEVGKVIEQLNPEVEAPKVQAKTAALEKMLNDKMTPRVRQILDTVERETQAKLDKENERYEAAKKRAEEDIIAKTETINKQEKRTAEQKQEAIDRYTAERRSAVEESHRNMVQKINSNNERFTRHLKMFRVGDSVLVPDDLTTDAFLGSSNGIFCGFKSKDEGITPSTTLAVFCTLDGRRKIEVKLSDWAALVRIDNMTQQNWDAAHEVTLSNWDQQIPSETRKHGFIMTGNILQAFADAGEDGRVPGQLVTYTDIDGNVHDGILMNQHWDPSQLKGTTVPLRSRMEEIKSLPYGDHIISADGNVVIERSFRYYSVSVPKSKKVGGQYYENEALLNLVSGNDFYPSRGTLKADVAVEDIEKVVEVLSDLGVQVQSDTQVRFDTETEMGQAQANGRRFDEDINEDNPIGKLISDTRKKYGLYGGAITQVVGSRSELEQIEGMVPDYVYRMIEDGYDKPGVSGLHISHLNIIIIFSEKVKDSNEGLLTFIHEQTHDYYDTLEVDLKEKFGKACLNFLRQNFAEEYDIVTRYSPSKWNTEACSFFTEAIVKKYGIEDFLNANLAGDENLCNFVSELRKHLKNGRQEKGRSNRLQQSSERERNGRGVSSRRRDDIRQRREGDSSSLQTHIAKHIDNLVEKLGTKARTTVYHSLDEVPKDVRKHIEEAHKRGRKVRGWYENGQIYLFLPDIDSIYQAEKTIWHETVAHHGLRQLIGEENLNKLLKQLWLEHRDGEMGKWVTERMQQNGWALNEAIEEYLAREAEKNPFKEPGLWQRLRWMLADILHKMGFASDPTISDIQYLFWQSQNQLRDNDPMGQIKQQAFLFNLNKEAANTPYINMNATRPEDIENPDAEGAYDDGVRHSEETDEEVIKRLEKEPKVKVYRAMQLIDGKLYPPMAAKQGGKLVKPIELGKWEKADEHPEMADNNGKFKLDKGNGKSLKAAYNPYIHTSTTMLNDQFSEAQSRPNLVVVEVEVPESELTSGYKAEKAKDAVGKLEWKAGIIQGQLTGTREVILSRWDKPVRIVPTEEVAKSIAEQIKGKVDVMPTNVVTPKQREELEKLGVKFVKTDNRGRITEGENKGETYSSIYGKNAGRRFDEDIDNPLDYSAKQVYNDRLNRVETVFSEAYQDSMIALKTAQNAIAQDKDIPDSQNAYMAENLMHGKNKNEQDLFNRMFRDPLIATINKIMNLTGMNWGDVDRYVYTKSGLERNRELYVRDWLESERNKRISKYEDLNAGEQDIYDGMAATIEDMFEDGDIDEAEKSKKLAQALQKAHQQHIDEIETEWHRVKDARYLDLKNGYSIELTIDSFTYADYLNALSDFILDNIDSDYKPEEHDYSGFRAMYGDEEGEYNEDAIIEELMNTEDAINGEDDEKTTDTLWEQINAATKYALERYREAGMRSDEDIDRVEQMFHFYVPMRGFKAETGEDMYQYFTGKDKSKSYVGGLLKHAKGRGSEADFPISTIFAMSYKAISDCNQNLVNQKFYRLCQANPNDLVVLSDSWAVFDEIDGVWKESTPEIPEDATEDEVRQITFDWENNMRQLALEHRAKKITGNAKFDYKPMDKKNQSEHIVDVRINGQPKKMIVTSNPRMAQALNGQLRFEHGKNVFSRWNAAIKNFMASVFTSYSPTFALRNMARDWTHFRTMLGVREGSGYAKQANKYYRQSLFKMVGLFKKYRDGKLDESKEMERDFKDFMDNGGITGFVFMQKLDDIQKEMENIYKKQKEGKTIRLNDNLWEKILGAVEALNEGIENNARFATYRASRHYAGRTKARSAYDAKEITVNFNRKGAGSKTAGYKSQNKAAQDAAKAFGVTAQILGEGKIFFNATVQAIATTFKNFQNADGSLNKKYIAKWAAKYALPPFMFGMLLPLINKALAAALGGDDDDPYANLPEWTRRKNICIYIGNGNFITIPIGQELAAFLTLGDIFAGNTYASDLKPINRGWDDEILGVMNTFSPVDIDTKTTKGGLMEDPISEITSRTFSVLAPLVAVEQNLGWTGRPIYKEDRFPNDKYKPEYQQVYQSTNPVLVGASKLLHEIGGGNDRARGKEWSEVNPAIIQYLWEQYTGGPGKVFSNTISIGKDAKDLFIEGEMPDFNIRKIEGLKAFVQQGDDRTQHYRTQAKFFKYQEDANKFKYDHDITKLRKQAKNDPVAKMELEKLSKTEEYQRFEIIEQANRSSKKEGKVGLDEFRKEIQNTTDRKEKRKKQQTYNELMKGYVDLLDDVGKE